MKSPKIQTKLVSFIIIIAVALLAGCSGRPSESNGRAVLQQKLGQQSKETKENIKVVSFRKTNATGDDKHYSLEYEAEIEFLADGAWSDDRFEFLTKQEDLARSRNLLDWKNLSNWKNVQQGQHATVKGNIQFFKTEKGWRGEDGNLY